MGGAAGGARKKEVGKEFLKRKGTNIRLTWEAYEKLTMLAAIIGPGTSLSEALEWMFEQNPEATKAVERAISERKRIAQ